MRTAARRSPRIGLGPTVVQQWSTLLGQQTHERPCSTHAEAGPACAGQRPTGPIEVQVTLARTGLPRPDADAAPAAHGSARSDAQLLIGTLHDDALLVRVHKHTPVCWA